MARQNWISLDLDERVFLEGSGSLNDHFWQAAGLDFDKFRVPSTSEHIDDLLRGRFADQRSAPLLRLPPELLHDILRLLNPTGAYIPAVFLFAITCKHALVVARPHLVRLQRAYYAPLAGHRLICIGSAARTLADYPASLTSGPEEALKALFPSKPTPCAEPAAPASLFDLAKTYWRWHAPAGAPSFLRPADLIWRPSAVSRMTMSDFLRFRGLCAPHYPPRARWALCSLSRREYVRADAVPPGPGPDAKPGARDDAFWRRNVARAGLACVCWSPDETTGMRGMAPGTPVNAALTRGRWAGDRFEMLTMDRLMSEDGKAWMDVTDEVVKLLRELWDCAMQSPKSRDVTLLMEYRTIYGGEAGCT
ncbi:hypothetical protein BD413DRAFT_607845 [Trametes elegans]|nr:hypothetical protein BD413DRAFT_607845 [Trametes elegans]